MRPLALKVSGLTCFRDEVTLDLAPLNLVAIAGPTGAGKSTLLDAMILSLYGFVPRMGAKNLTELISHGRSSLSVVFDFAVDQKSYRIARAIHRGKRASQAILSELANDDGIIKEIRLASGIKEVQEQVRALLGIDGEAFTQAVILPQGRFQDFLKATPGDRRKIMNELLGLKVYDLMRVKASELAVKHGAEVDALETQLGDLKDLDEGALVQREAERQDLTQQKDDALVRQREAREALTRAETLARILSRKSKYLSDAAELEARRAEMDLQRDMLARLSKVTPLIAQLERGEDLKVKLARAQRVLDTSTSAVELARRELEAAEASLEQAQSAAEAVTLLRQKMAELDLLKGQVEARAQAHAALTQAKVEAEAVRRALEAAEAETQTARTTLQRKTTDVDTQRRVVAALEPPRDELARLAARRDRVLALGHALRELESRHLALTSAREQATSTEDAWATSEADRKKKEVAEVLAHEALSQALEALEAFRRQEAAAALRAHLHDGDACPVCLQTVAEVPRPESTGPAMDTLTTAVEQKRQVHQKASAAADRARRQEEGHKARHDAAATTVSTAEVEVARRTATVTAELREVLDVGLDAAQDGLARFEARLAELTDQDTAWRAAHDTLERLTRALAEHAAALEKHELLLSFTHDRHRDALAKVADLAARADASNTGVPELDPVAEKQKLERSVASLEAARETAQSAVSRAQAAHAAAVATQAAHRQSTDTFAVELARLESELVVKLAALGLSLDEARDLADEADPTRLAAMTRALDHHDAATSRVAADLRAIDEELGGRALAPDEVATWERRLAEATAHWERALTTLATLESELTRLRQQLERVAKVKTQLDAAREAHRIHKRLGEDLKSNQFQEYVLEEVNADLAAGASERLLTLSGERYRLGSGKDGYEVFDEDHGGERRSTDTLSGGETFLASLALALELSEQIQRKSGKVHLDCIFIDEGFGTLDAETLETVAEAVEALGATGRLVGLITHVPELAQRMPDRIQVDKTGEGSRLRVITA